MWSPHYGLGAEEYLYLIVPQTVAALDVGPVPVALLDQLQFDGAVYFLTRGPLLGA